MHVNCTSERPQTKTHVKENVSPQLSDKEIGAELEKKTSLSSRDAESQHNHQLKRGNQWTTAVTVHLTNIAGIQAFSASTHRTVCFSSTTAACDPIENRCENRENQITQ